MTDTTTPQVDQPLPTTTYRQTTDLRRWAEAFVRAKLAQRRARTTIRNYAAVMANWVTWCDLRGISEVEALTPADLREYLIHLGERGHNPGGVAGHYRPIRTMLIWYEGEAEPDAWRNPIRKVPEPRQPDPDVVVATVHDVRALLSAASRGTDPVRDTAIVLLLFDTGLRAGEVVACNVADVDQIAGTLLVMAGKGGRARVVVVGERTRKALRRWLRQHADGPLFVTRGGDRLTYWGLRQVIRRTAERAGIKAPPLHSFRRGSTTERIRNGEDRASIKRQMGWSTDEMLDRYDRRTASDMARTTAQASPVDRAGL